ncbi:DUF4350 domain-containing protein [Microbulbifer sp. SAOS-129_SWC]|uniref:DUF4350 domain-containing protein n=1 Tax=Microbulbifer sp. SAOS-129_SWC TaxID=3145235 RepID=UPI0032171D76
MRAKPLLTTAVAALLCAAAVALFLRYFERYSEEADRGWGDAARRDPYLAAELFLTAAGHHSRRADNLAVLDSLDTDTTLFIASSTQVYNADKASALLDWVERGGHAIVVAADRGENERDWLLDPLGTTVVTGSTDFYGNNPLQQLLGGNAKDYEDKKASEILREHNRKLREASGDGEERGAQGDSNKDSAKGDADAPPRDPDVDDAHLALLGDNSGTQYRVYFNPLHLLWHPALAESDARSAEGGDPVSWARIDSEDAGVPLLQFERGDGLLTLLADAGLWRSERIGQFDNAYLLSELAADGDVVLLTQPRFDALPVLARRYASEFFLAGGLALIAWLLLRTQRFGPRAAEPQTARRSLLEHIAACGHYYWRSNRAERLLCGYRTRLLRRLGGDNASAGVRRRLCVELNARTPLTESQIAACLWGDPPRDEDTFTEQMRNLQQIEAAL